MNVGDKVVVLSARFPEQNGLTGRIVRVDVWRGLNVQIRYDDTEENNTHPYAAKYPHNHKLGLHTNTYSEDDLVVMRHFQMEPPDWELEEIEKAQTLLQDLQKAG